MESNEKQEEVEGEGKCHVNKKSRTKFPSINMLGA